MNKKVVENLKGLLSEFQRRQLDGVSWYLYGLRGSGKTYTGAVAAMIRAVEFPNTTIMLYEHGGNELYMMLTVADYALSLIKRLPVEEQCKFMVVKIRPMYIKYMPDSTVVEAQKIISGGNNDVSVESSL